MIWNARTIQTAIINYIACSILCNLYDAKLQGKMAPHLTRRQQKAVDAQKQAQIELGANRQQADLLRQVDGKRPFCYGDYSFFKDHQVQFLDFPTRESSSKSIMTFQYGVLTVILLSR